MSSTFLALKLWKLHWIKLKLEILGNNLQWHFVVPVVLSTILIFSLLHMNIYLILISKIFYREMYSTVVLAYTVQLWLQMVTYLLSWKQVLEIIYCFNGMIGLFFRFTVNNLGLSYSLLPILFLHGICFQISIESSWHLCSVININPDIFV